MHHYFKCAALACAFTFITNHANAHGFEGDRFFPPTVTTDDPFATDEFLGDHAIVQQPGQR